MKRLYALVVTFFICLTASSQEFKWVTGGGTTDIPAGGHSEQVDFMCIDPNGNVYVISQVGSGTVTADTFSGIGVGSDRNILITSYACNGQMRWAKLIYSADQCIPNGICADSLGHIYFSGLLPHNSGHTLYIGRDTSVSGLMDDLMGVIQFDTLGNFNWIRFVGNNTISTLTGCAGGNSPIAVDGANNLHFFFYANSGVVVSSSLTTMTGTYDLVYDPSGALLSGTRLDLDTNWYLDRVIIDPVTNKMYTTGETNMSLLTSPPVDTFFAAVFDASRNLIWKYSPNAGNGMSDVTIDASRHLYFSGECAYGVFVFNGDSVSDPGYSDFGVVMKTDSNGHPEWFRHFDDPSGVDVAGLNSITLLPNAKIASTGVYAGTLHANGSTTDTLPNQPGWDPYLVILDSSGNLMALQAMICDGFYNVGLSVTSDKIGNIYVGGYEEDSIYAGTPPISAYHTVGGNTDYFVMKYGYDCSCTIAPTASYTDTGTSRTLHFTYTGTTTSIDSVVWSYGDGTSDTGLTSVHTYATRDTYHVCVTVYTECGSDTYCSNAIVPLSSLAVPSVVGGSVAVYPNPASDELNISGILAVTSYRLLNITGVTIQAGTFHSGSNKLSMQRYAPGMYILEMTDTNGTRNVVRVVKE